MAFSNQTRPTEVAKQQEKQKACERPNMEKVCGVGCLKRGRRDLGWGRDPLDEVGGGVAP